ncbi:MAG: 3-deoxy-manno-octulosonate cytidylyltransferase [Candidatus Cloacimonas sp.]|jgi:3-deoxy-manno-octulosonate cytidylyltransferase (CMP-KDO synthetase)|nr:3-deoxy-manno-octulosonate cytidylyltransferase [Candidatus Cloacimonas sp.]
MTNVIAIIPARYASTRFPAKALALLKGKPLIQHVWQRVTDSGLFTQVIVATDHPLIMEAVAAFGGLAVMTAEHHQSGSDRIAEAAMHFPQAQLIINVQGDEPHIDTSSLADLIAAFNQPDVLMGSLMTPITDTAMLSNPNIVKVVTDNKQNALYFSRSSIPFNRDNDIKVNYCRHIGVYAYLRETLLNFVSLPVGVLEKIEKLEQLRALENGIPIRMVQTLYQGIGVDTPEDLLNAEKALL